MEVTKTTIKIAHPRMRSDGSLDERLMAYVSIDLDDQLCLHDIRLVRGKQGRPFLSMPHRKIEDRCHVPECNQKTALDDRYCRSCGARLADNRAATSPDGKALLFVDVVHPVVTECREMLEHSVLEAYHDEMERSGAMMLPNGHWEYAVKGPAPLASRVHVVAKGA